eukprot:m.46037 g.46037  ORF g.46037 m.46037 type:complete len:322 (+) comp15330_c0_seq1:545-1510(+)
MDRLPRLGLGLGFTLVVSVVVVAPDHPPVVVHLCLLFGRGPPLDLDLAVPQVERDVEVALLFLSVKHDKAVQILEPSPGPLEPDPDAVDHQEPRLVHTKHPVHQHKRPLRLLVAISDEELPVQHGCQSVLQLTLWRIVRKPARSFDPLIHHIAHAQRALERAELFASYSVLSGREKPPIGCVLVRTSNPHHQHPLLVLVLGLEAELAILASGGFLVRTEQREVSIFSSNKQFTCVVLGVHHPDHRMDCPQMPSFWRHGLSFLRVHRRPPSLRHLASFRVSPQRIRRLGWYLIKKTECRGRSTAGRSEVCVTVESNHTPSPA